MKFDAIAKKEAEQKKIPKKVQKEINKINQVYPVIGLTESGYIHTKAYWEEYSLYLEIQPQDLYYLSEEEFKFVTSNYWAMHKQFNASLKEIYLAFPENNRKQQEYFMHKIDTTLNPKKLNYLNNELDKLKYIEKNFVCEQSYMVVYGRSITALEKNYEKLRKVGNDLFHFQPFTEEKLSKLLYLLNNTGGILYEEE